MIEIKTFPAPYQPTPEIREKVLVWSACGMSQEKIGMALGINRDTVAKHFKEELKSGKAIIESRLIDKTYAGAMAGDRILLALMLKTKMGWKETKAIEHSGSDGAPIKIKSIQRVMVKNAEDLEAVKAMIAASNKDDEEEGEEE